MAKIAYLFLTISAMAGALPTEHDTYTFLYAITKYCFTFGIVTLIFLSWNNDRFMQIIKVAGHLGFWFLAYVVFLIIWSVCLSS
jgi:hypothetical protein